MSRPRRLLVRLRVALVASVACLACGVAACVAQPGRAAAPDPDLASVLTRPVSTRERSLAHESTPFRQARRVLPGEFREYPTRRFVVLSDADPRWTRRQAALLDRTYHQYLRYTRRLGAEPKPLRHKLVCVLFEQYEDYRHFARSQDNVTADWISGYYSPKHDRIVFYNIETNPDFARARAAAEDAPAVVADVADDADDADDGLSCCAVTARNRTAEGYRQAAIATVLHEAVHQLAFHTRLQTPHLQNPLWLSEGLATAFETDSPGRSFGPDYRYALRDRMFDELAEEGKLIPLRELVTYARMPSNDDDTVAAVYHQSYALMTWISRHRSGELQDFFERLLAEPPGRPTPARHLQLFEASFGDVEALERLWMRAERQRSKG